MKTTAKQLTTYGNLGIVQLRIEPESIFYYKPAGPEMETGSLVISEATGEGVVGKLFALNKTDLYLLLTDADVLIGAKQNRVVNKSILLPPLSKTILDVSCIERLRWQYNAKNFSNPNTTADPDLRKEKAHSIAYKRINPDEKTPETQSTVWSHVEKKIRQTGFNDKTESYEGLINFSMKKSGKEFPVCEPEKMCNGMALVLDGKVVCIDLFGTEEVYQYYFPMLRDSAFRMVYSGKEHKSVDIHEAYYKVLETIDNFETAKRHPESSYGGAGSLNIIESKEQLGFELTSEGQLIHNVIFLK